MKVPREYREAFQRAIALVTAQASALNDSDHHGHVDAMILEFDALAPVPRQRTLLALAEVAAMVIRSVARSSERPVEDVLSHFGLRAASLVDEDEDGD